MLHSTICTEAAITPSGSTFYYPLLHFLKILSFMTQSKRRKTKNRALVAHMKKQTIQPYKALKNAEAAKSVATVARTPC
jgi:hypothetical protein